MNALPICTSCEKSYDNGTNGIHGCEPMDRIAVLEAEVEKLHEVAKAADRYLTHGGSVCARDLRDALAAAGQS